jgi:hypothetical protein
MPISECDLESETTRSTRAEEEMFLPYTRGDKFPVPTIQMTNESNLSVATFKNQETGSTRVRNGNYKDCLKALRSDNAVRFSTGSTIISIHFDCDHNEKHSRRCLTVCCIRFTLNICVV